MFFFPCLFLCKPTKTLFCVKFTTNVTFQWETPCICLTQFFSLPVFSVPLHSQHWVFVGLNIKGLRKSGASRFEFLRLPDMECHMCLFFFCLPPPPIVFCNALKSVIGRVVTFIKPFLTFPALKAYQDWFNLVIWNNNNKKSCLWRLEWIFGAIIYRRSDSGPSCVIPRILFACVHIGAEWCVWKACRNANLTHFLGTCRGFSLLHNFSKVCYTSGSHCLFFKPLNPPSFSCSKGQIFWQLCAGTRFVKSFNFYSY